MSGYFHRNMTPSEFLRAWLNGKLLSGPEKDCFDGYYHSYLKRFPPLVQKSYNRRLASALRIIHASERPLHILEVGVGCGTESLYFALLGNRVAGVDIIKKMVDTAQRRKEILQKELGQPIQCEFYHSDILDFAPEEPFDLIWMEEAFHHLEPRDLIVPKITSLLKSGGHLIITECNALNPLMQMKLLYFRGIKTVTEWQDEFGTVHMYGVERILPSFMLTRWFQRNGISPVELEYFRFFPNLFSGNRLLMWLDSWMHQWLPLFLKRFLCVHYNYIGVSGPRHG